MISVAANLIPTSGLWRSWLGRGIASLVVATVIGTMASAEETPLQAVVTINKDAGPLEYSPLLWGGFIEHFDGQIYGGLFEPGSTLADARGFRTDVVAALRELKLSVVRWPGGCFASGYHWKDGIGPQRRPTPDPVWGVTDPNTFGTVEFVEWCRLVGCEPYICTNAGNGTPEEMQQWVEYCNGTKGEYAKLRQAHGQEKPLHVKYWSIGNENYGFWEIGRKTPQEWGPLVHRCAQLMRAADPDIKLLAAATKKPEWSMPLLQGAGQDLNYVAVHEYWFNLPKSGAMPPYKDCVKHCDGPERTIAEVLKILDDAGCRGRVKIAFDEWNLRHWHHPGFPRKNPVKEDDQEALKQIAQRELNHIADHYTVADAIFTASFLNACLRNCQDVGMANIAPIVNTRGPLYVHPKGLVRRTTFHALAMYANLLESRVGQLTVHGSTFGGGKTPLAVVDAVATVDEAKQNWSIVLVNRHPSESVACTVKLGERALDGTWSATTLAGDSPEAFNDIEHPDRVVPTKTQLKFNHGLVTLPPHSLTIVKVR